MFRRPSLTQPTPSTFGNGRPIAKSSHAPPIPTNAKEQLRVSMSNTVTTIKDGGDFNIDELFTKHTISEIRVMQNRLRADADAKKEELRQMVGERYRDLLQASSSIISIARSSQRVVEVLGESKVAVQSQADPPLPKASSVSNIQDRHLYALQILAAHMKLLLDAPEHLWRLIERKKFFPAAWLFLLARVVHRALVRSDEQDEETWKDQGLDVLVEFPLIQRQWEVVSQFRSQIIHKATLGLRDASSSIEDTCATLVTLHLLDSRPLHDTLSSMFSQRLKTLNTSLTSKSQIGPSAVSSSSFQSTPNGNFSFSLSQDISNPPPSKPRVREVKDSLHSALIIISKTMHVARGIFQGNSERSLIEHVLEFIQSDTEKSTTIPMDLHLTTRTLLTNVTSVAHFQLLPHNLQSYKPYVDLSSTSASLRQEHILNQLDQWFKQSLKLFQSAVGSWFQELESVKEVWNVRLAARKWIEMSTLRKEEKAQILGAVDQSCRQRIVKIWELMVEAASSSFETALETSLRSINSGKVDFPIDFLFTTAALPAITHSSSNYDIPLRKYQSSLKQQLLGRTTLLDNVLSTLERCARHIDEEIALIRSSTQGEAKPIVDLLIKLHEPTAEQITKSSVHALQEAVNQIEGDDDGAIQKLMFLEQITEDLALRSPFIHQIGCSQMANDAFVEGLSMINDAVLDTWKRKTITRIVREAKPSHRVIPSSSVGPTPELMQALISLHETLQEITFRWNKAKQIDLVQDVFPLFIEAWLKNGPERDHITSHDLAFLREFARLTLGSRTTEVVQTLETQLETMKPDVGRKTDLGRVSSEFVRRLQTFFPTTPIKAREKSGKESADKFPNLLRYGQPSMEQQALQSSLDLPKPGPRFGLLLVGGDDSR